MAFVQSCSSELGRVPWESTIYFPSKRLDTAVRVTRNRTLKLSGMVRMAQAQLAARRLDEEKLYEQVLAEVTDGHRRDGIWAKCLAEANGDISQARSAYVKARVQSIKDERILANEIERTTRQPIDDEAIGRIREEDRISRVLEENGYRLKPKRNGYVVVEPLGGREKLRSLAELQEYVKRCPSDPISSG